MELGCECMIEHQFMVHTLEFATCILACVRSVEMCMTEKQFMVHTLEFATCILACVDEV